MAKRWKFTTGIRPLTVTVYERVPGSMLQLRTWDPSLRKGAGNWVRRSLGHRNRVEAQRLAIRVAAELESGPVQSPRPQIDLGKIVDEYTQHRTPRKSPLERQADGRSVALFSAFLGRSRAPEAISLQALGAVL